MRMEGPRTPNEIARARKERAQGHEPEAGIEHMPSVTDLYAYLKTHGHEEACANAYSCDPWKYEPVLFEDLIDIRATTNDAVALRELRGLIRAGSWMTYERQTPEDLRSHLKTVRTREQQEWEWRIRNADPDTSKEYREGMKEEMEDLDQVEHALRMHAVGEEAAKAAKTVEDLAASAWLELKKQVAANGLEWDDVPHASETRQLYKEVEGLRPLRDELYFRSLYPNLATHGRA